MTKPPATSNPLLRSSRHLRPWSHPSPTGHNTISHLCFLSVHPGLFMQDPQAHRNAKLPRNTPPRHHTPAQLPPSIILSWASLRRYRRATVRVMSPTPSQSTPHMPRLWIVRRILFPYGASPDRYLNSMNLHRRTKTYKSSIILEPTFFHLTCVIYLPESKVCQIVMALRQVRVKCLKLLRSSHASSPLHSTVPDKPLRSFRKV